VHNCGCDTTAYVAGQCGRRWIAFEKNHGYLAASVFRFAEGWSSQEVEAVWKQINSENLPVMLPLRKQLSFLFRVT